MKFYRLLRNGVVDQNPVFVQLLALCPLLAVTTSAVNAIAMGISTTAVMLGACTIISIFRRFFMNEIRIAAFVVIVASFVTILQLMLEVHAPPEINEALGIYIPLIVVNCILFARIESFASKNKVLPSIVDAFGMGMGFTLGLLAIGIIREFLGAGSVFGIELIRDTTSHVLIMIMAPGAFFTLGALIMIRNYFVEKRKRG
ncbi:MAG: electron transport complex subunit RsxE [Treponema sp.]|nr:electron transport complex subunit RsxE [Treponema sp.]